MIQSLNPQSRNLRLQTSGDGRYTHGEVIRSPFLGDSLVCDVYLRITCNDVPDNEAAHMHVRSWIESILNIPFSQEGHLSHREYKVEEVKVTEMSVVV